MEELIEILEDINPDVEYETCEDLMSGGYLTSFDLVVLISEIAETFQVKIPADQIIPENFESMQKIYQLIQTLQGEC